jgi:3-deoxy-D-manno-octulosonate 8-phosphate phosphatase (KDO 8-P phosphatase)
VSPPIPSLQEKLAKVKLFLCDVDGILTDGTVLITETAESKVFHIQDGLGLKILQRTGIKVGWISNRPSAVTTRRGQELKIDFVVQQSGVSKVKLAEQILTETGLTFAEVSYAGDDVVDLGLLQKAGVAFAVPNGIEETKAIADYVTRAAGGQGAIREMITLLLKAQNKWPHIVEEYSKA